MRQEERTMPYEGDIYRPPSEAHSLIVQVTVGCTHNRCAFCSMYKAKQFRLKPFEEIRADLEAARRYNRHVERIFFADGDALCMTTEKLVRLLDAVHVLFPECTRIGIYGRASHILRKSEAELVRLREAGLGIIYIGAESGSDEVLRRIDKGETAAEIAEAVQKAERVGLQTSVTFIIGLGGRELTREHAIKTGEMISAMGASYVGLLTLLLEPAAPLYADLQSGKFELLSPLEAVEELELMLAHTDCKAETVLRSNHASNWLALKGTLPQDKERMLREIRVGKADASMLRPEGYRAL